jgi:hypothetical protein
VPFFLIRFTVAALSTRITAATESNMTSDDFRYRAAECLRSAQRAANDCTRGLWLSMAQRWLDRAETRVEIERGASHTAEQRKLCGSA